MIGMIPLYCIAHPYCAVYHAQLARARKENGGFFYFSGLREKKKIKKRVPGPNDFFFHLV